MLHAGTASVTLAERAGDVVTAVIRGLTHRIFGGRSSVLCFAGHYRPDRGTNAKNGESSRTEKSTFEIRPSDIPAEDFVGSVLIDPEDSAASIVIKYLEAVRHSGQVQL